MIEEKKKEHSTLDKQNEAQYWKHLETMSETNFGLALLRYAEIKHSDWM